MTQTDVKSISGHQDYFPYVNIFFVIFRSARDEPVKSKK